MNAHWKRHILIIWLGQAVSLLTSSVMQMSIIWYVTIETGSAAMLSFAAIIAFLPQALLGLFAGVLIDRLNKKAILIAADCFLALTSIALALAAMFGTLPLWLIFVMLGIRSVGIAFHEPTAQAIIPLFVPQAQLTQAAGLSQGFDAICMLLSPGLALVLYEYWSLPSILLLDVAGAVIAVLLLLFVHFPKREKAKKEPLKPIHLISDTRDGIREMRRYPGILSLVIIGMVYIAIYAPIGVLYPHMTMVYFGGSTAQSGFVEMVFSAGSLLGALLMGLLGARLSKRVGLVGSIFCYGVGVLSSGLLPPSGFAAFAALSFATGLTIPFYHGMTRAIFQLVIPEGYLGRVFALSESSTLLVMPIGLLVGGAVADVLGANVLFMIQGVLAMLLALVLSRLRALRSLSALCARQLEGGEHDAL